MLILAGPVWMGPENPVTFRVARQCVYAGWINRQKVR